MATSTTSSPSRSGPTGTIDVDAVLARARALLALHDPTQDEVLAAAEQLAAARLRVRDLLAWRPASTERLAIDPLERAHRYVVEARTEVRSGGSLAAEKRLARAQLAEVLVARRSGFSSYEAYRRAHRPRTSFTATALRRRRAYRELAEAEARWQRIRASLLGDVVLDLTGDEPRLGTADARATSLA